MSLNYSIDWLVKNQVIFLWVSGDISGDVSAAFFEQMNAKVVELLRAGEPPVHVLIDAQELGKFPFDLLSGRHLATYLEEPNLGLITMYGASRLASSFGQLLTSIAGVQMHLMRDYAHAIHVLAAKDPRLRVLLSSGELPNAPPPKTS